MKNNTKNLTPNRKRKKNKIRSGMIFFLIFLLIALIAAVVVVSFIKPDNKSVQVVVTVTAEDGSIILNSPVTVVAPKPTAAMAFEKAFNEQGIPYKLENGMYTEIAGLKLTDTHSWMYYINGSQAQVGAAEYELEENNTLEFKYENYANPTPAPSAAPDAEDGTAVKVIITGDDSDSVESSVILEDGKSTAEEAFNSVCDKSKIEYSVSGGEILSCGKYNSDEEYSWVCYVNGKATEDKLSKITLEPADVVEFKYEKSE